MEIRVNGNRAGAVVDFGEHAEDRFREVEVDFKKRVVRFRDLKSRFHRMIEVPLETILDQLVNKVPKP